jgi:hypothetical protein
MIDELRELLVQDEGMVLAVYLDHLGFSTAGCGHFLQEQDPERGWPVGMAISQERADQWLEKDMKQCVSDAHWLQPDFDSFPVPAQITVASSGVPIRDAEIQPIQDAPRCVADAGLGGSRRSVARQQAVSTDPRTHRASRPTA